MYNFEYYNPTRIIFGRDKLACIDSLIPAQAKVLITYGRGSAKRSGLIDRVRAILGSRTVLEFGGIEPNPRFETLMKAVDVVRSESIDFLLAVGGGSVLDGTKFITLAAGYSGDARDLLFYGFRLIPFEMVGATVPFGTVLTLPATGSEMNNGAVVSYEHGKFPIKSELTFPRFSVLDPSLSFTLPAIQVANGVVDAFVHTTEQYLTVPVDARIQDRMAEGILQTLIEIGEINVKGTDNYDARANLYWSATLALNGLIGTGVPQDWATHMMGHELTALYEIDHAQTLAIILPALLEVRRDKKRAKLLKYAENVWQIRDGNEEEKIDRAIQKTRSFFESLGVRTRLSQYGIGADQVDVIVGQMETHGLIALSETGDQTPDISREILKKAL